MRLAADQLDALTDGMPDDVKAKAAAKAAEYRKNADRADSPAEDNNRQVLMDKARTAEQRRDHAAAQDPYFDFAETLLQIAIVLASVFVLTEMPILLWSSRALAILGVLLAVDGFTQWLPLPLL